MYNTNFVLEGHYLSLAAVITPIKGGEKYFSITYRAPLLGYVKEIPVPEGTVLMTMGEKSWRKYAALDSFEEFTLRLGFEHGWNEVPYASVAVRLKKFGGPSVGDQTHVSTNYHTQANYVAGGASVEYKGEEYKLTHTAIDFESENFHQKLKKMFPGETVLYTNDPPTYSLKVTDHTGTLVTLKSETIEGLHEKYLTFKKEVEQAEKGLPVILPGQTKSQTLMDILYKSMYEETGVMLPIT